MVIDPQSLVGPILSGIVTAAGVIFALSNRLVVVETKFDDLSEKVEKHNSVVERTYKLESDVSTMWKRFDEHSTRLDRLEEKKGR